MRDSNDSDSREPHSDDSETTTDLLRSHTNSVLLLSSSTIRIWQDRLSHHNISVRSTAERLTKNLTSFCCGEKNQSTMEEQQEKEWRRQKVRGTRFLLEIRLLRLHEIFLMIFLSSIEISCLFNVDENFASGIACLFIENIRFRDLLLFFRVD